MAEIFVISDQHFSHRSILDFVDSNGNKIRPIFSNIDEMDEYMIEKHNETIKPQDKVYFCGDVGFSRNRLDIILPKLNGKKRLILGNHDAFKPSFYEKHFQKVMLWRVFREFNIILSHMPLHLSNIKLDSNMNPMISCHGHIHQNLPPKGPYVNVSVEMIDYTPVNVEDIPNLLLKQQSLIV